MKRIVKFFWKHKINVLFYSAYTFALGLAWFAIITEYEKFDKWDYMFTGILGCGLWMFICIDYWEYVAKYWQEKYYKEVERCNPLRFLGNIDE